MDFEWIGWCRDGSSDKVWVLYVLERDNRRTITRYATIWGRRGKALQSKVFNTHPDGWAEDRINQKARKGYQLISKVKLNEVYPEFESDLEKAAFWATLKG